MPARSGSIRRCTVSEHAAAQAPTKLGLKPGQTIAVEDAIKAHGHPIGKRRCRRRSPKISAASEEAFARLMTQKAHALGMSRHHLRQRFGPAGRRSDHHRARSGAARPRDPGSLPALLQVFLDARRSCFTARPSAITTICSARSPGVDGIKTGFTRASGFNLVTSVHRDGRYLVARGARRPLGRASATRICATLIEYQHQAGSPRTSHRSGHRRSGSHDNGETAPSMAPSQFSAAKAQARDYAKPAAPARGAPGVTANSGGHAVARHQRSDPSADRQDRDLPRGDRAFADDAADAGAGAVQRRPRSSRPASRRRQLRSARCKLNPRRLSSRRSHQCRVIAPAKPEPGPPVAAAVGYQLASASSVVVPASHAHSGWLIQIGAYDAEDEARQHLTEAKLKLHAALASADPFTERVQKGDTTLYRARFAGFDKATAEATCRQLKRNDFACITVKD